MNQLCCLGTFTNHESVDDTYVGAGEMHTIYSVENLIGIGLASRQTFGVWRRPCVTWFFLRDLDEWFDMRLSIRTF